MITIFSERAFTADSDVQLTDAAAQHVRVRRGRAGDPIRILDGRGSVGSGSIAAVGKRVVTVAVAGVESQPRPSELIAFVPVADRPVVTSRRQLAVDDYQHAPREALHLGEYVR